MNVRRFDAVVALSSALALAGCDNESSRAPVAESVVEFAAIADAEANEFQLKANLRRIVSVTLTTPVLLEPADTLRIEVRDSSASLSYSPEDLIYSGTLMPLITGRGTLTYDRTTGGERSGTGLILTHAVRDVTTDERTVSLRSNVEIPIRWSLEVLDDDTSQLPSNTALLLRPRVCTRVDGTAEPVAAEFASSTLVLLDPEALSSGRAMVRTEQLEAGLRNRGDRSVYSSCTAEIWLESKWTTEWDGTNPAEGRNGPAWIDPDPAFANERLQSASWFAFGIRNLSARLDIDIDI